MTGGELLLLPVVLISLSVIISLWLLIHRFLRSETQAEHEEAMPPGRDGRGSARGPDTETPQSVTTLEPPRCQNLRRMQCRHKNASLPPSPPH